MLVLYPANLPRLLRNQCIEVYIMRIKHTVCVLLVACLAIGFIFLPRYNQRNRMSNQIDIMLQQGDIVNAYFRYEAIYTGKDVNGNVVTVVVEIPQDKINSLKDGSGLHSYLIEYIKESIQEFNLELPDDFENYIRIATVLER